MTIGESVRRAEDAPLLRGAARYTGDIVLPGAWSAMIVRSPMAHALVGEIDTEAARSLPGVIGVFTAAHLAADLGRVPIIETRVSFDEAVVPYLQPVLAVDRVRYVGEPLALVIATDRYVAEDAADLVFADLDPLATALDCRTAGDDEPLFAKGNEVTVLRTSFGDIEDRFADAEIIVERELSTGRHTGVPMETRGLTVHYDDGKMIIYGSAKVPHYNRHQLATHLGIPEDDIRMLEVAVGGGFGVRGEYYPEDFLIPWAAWKLKRSVAWMEDRREHFLACNHSREQYHRGAIAGAADGRIIALRTEFWTDMGAYVRTHGIRVPSLTMEMVPGPYDIDAYEAVGHLMVTNKTPIGTYRAPGRFESCFVRERLVDFFAATIEMDPIELRRRNLIAPERLPYTRTFQPSGQRFEFREGHHPLFEEVTGAIPRAEIAARRASGECVGAGIAMFLEKGGGVGPWETGSVAVTSDGDLVVRSGCPSVGQGIRTVLAQIAADVFQLPIDRVRVELLDTDLVAKGIGTFGSRGTITAGNAVHMAATTVLEKACELAARALEVAAADLLVKEGRFEVAGSPQTSVSLEQVAASVTGDELSCEETFHISEDSFPYGVHAAIVSVDPEVGSVKVEKMIIGYEVGRAVNPQLVEGQLHGGAMQGLGGAVLEHFRYDEDGNPLVTSLMDYLMPTMSEAPRFEVFIGEDAPGWNNPLGVKGAGEGGVTGVAAAVAAAVDDALGTPGSVMAVPIDPATICRADSHRPQPPSRR